MVRVENKKQVIALLSPAKNAYSETFIAAHKERLPYDVKYYYDGYPPKQMEGKGILLRHRLLKEFFRILKYRFQNKLASFKVYESALAKSFAQEKVKLVLAEYGPMGVSVLKICRKKKIPLLVHFHGHDTSIRSVIAKYGEAYKALFGYASYVFSVSGEMSQTLMNLGCPVNKVIYNPYGPHEDFLQVNSDSRVKINKFVTIGRFTDKKAQYYIILAFYEVQKQFPDAKLILAGDGFLKNTCKNLVNYLGIKSKIEFPGAITRKQWIDHLQNAFAFLQHSVTADNGDKEGLPVAVLEACAAGLPVIATRHAGIPDVIQHGVNGLLVDEHDVNGMITQMLYLLNNRETAKEFGKAARQTIIDSFSLDNHINIITSAIERAINV